MKTRISPTVVGAFVVGALVLLVFALVNFGAGGLFREPARFVIIVRQTSVSGLDPGSSVKFSGVRVGRVQSVRARLDPENNEVVVRIVCDIDERDAESLFPPPTPPRKNLIEELVRRGLRGKLSFSGITGLMYVDLEVAPETAPPSVEVDGETGAPIVPLQASLLAEVADTLGTIANNLAQFDFPGISTELKTLLVNLNRLTKELEIKSTLERVGAAADSVDRLAADENLRQSFARLNAASGELQELLAELRAGVPEVQADIQLVLAEAGDAMKSLSRAGDEIGALAGPRSGVAEEFGRTLVSRRRAAESIEQLADYLERNPGALVRGRAAVTNDQPTEGAPP